LKNIISYSLYGDDSMYIYGAIQNSLSVKYFYPEWVGRFYVSSNVAKDVVEELIKNGSEVVIVNECENNLSMLWRFRVFSDEDVECAMIRDADSRLSKREVGAVNEWLDSGKDFHIMRDHPNHQARIMGGMWGAKVNALRNIDELLILAKDYLKDEYGGDQYFLAKYVYPLTIDNACIHVSSNKFERKGKHFPTTRKDNLFVGLVFDEFNNPKKEQIEMLIKYEQDHFFRMVFNLKLFIKIKLKMI